jgi:hypothetical protein
MVASSREWFADGKFSSALFRDARILLRPSARRTPVPANQEPPPPNVNLAGFPLPYRQGYADGCASAKGTERKDAARFGADPNYRTGWQDGLALCKKR